MAEASGLSAREAQILTLFAEGKSAADVAQLLSITPRTVMWHYRRVADRYGTLNRTHTVIEALRRGDLFVDGLTSSPPPKQPSRLN